MLTATTKAAILALLAVDKSATDEDRTRIAESLDGVMTITQVEAARRLGVSRKTISRRIRDGILRTAADGHRIPVAALLTA